VTGILGDSSDDPIGKNPVAGFGELDLESQTKLFPAEMASVVENGRSTLTRHKRLGLAEWDRAAINALISVPDHW
jgi:hypothetical protein